MPSAVGSQAAKRMQKVGLDVQRAQVRAVNRAALASKTVLVTEIRRDAPRGKLRNVGKNGAKVGARYDVKGTRNPTALVRATGPLHLIENPSKAHEIKPRKRGRGAGKKALATPFGPRASVQHPGVRRPRKPWSRGMHKARPAAQKMLGRTYVDAFRRGAKR